MQVELGAFLAIAIAVILTPGQDTALTVRNSLAGGRAAGVATAAGIAAGQSIWTVATAIGLTAVVVASEPLLVAIRVLGAGYLVLLGLRSIARAVRGSSAGAAAGRATAPAVVGGPAFRAGLLSSLANPELVVFFSSLLPQVVAPGPGFLAGTVGLGFLFAIMTFSWLGLYAAVLGWGRRRSMPVLRRVLDFVLGSALVALGTRLAVAPMAAGIRAHGLVGPAPVAVDAIARRAAWTTSSS